MKDIKCLCISDVHLGNARNTTKEIINNLDVFFSHYTRDSQFIDLDIIFIAGDLFDLLLSCSGTEFSDILLWQGRLINFCARYNIKLRILEGTPSHDWKQSRNALAVHSLTQVPVDFKYVETLHIEYIEEYDCNILYVPDEWNADTSVTLEQVKSMMYDMKLKQVDIAIMHGSFDHQLPSAAHNAPRHDATSYLSLVKHYICIGHIHIHSVFERILAQGSFDRISHNEEEPKGGILFNISEKGDSFFFIENKGAKIFKTIVLKHKDLDRSLLQIDKALKNIPDNSYVRIKALKDHPLYVAFDELKVKFPMYVFTKTNIEDEEDRNSVVRNAVNLDKTYNPVTINKDNIVTLVMQEVKLKHNLPQDKLELLNSMLVQNNG